VLRTSAVISNNYERLCAGVVTKIANCFERGLQTPAASFYAKLITFGYDPDAHIDVLAEHRLIYVCVPKCGSTTIKGILSTLVGRNATSFEHIHKRRYSGLKSPSQVGLSTLYRTAIDSRGLRFSFVRNPYERLVSAWADKFRDKPLVPGDSFVEKYLNHRQTIDADLPAGRDRTLAFSNFVTFASATANQRLDAHWQRQNDILDMPGINLDLVGKMESFGTDFARVLQHVGACEPFKTAAATPLHRSLHQPWPHYYAPTLADRVYRAYESDFDRLGYPRAIQK
jgi:Sulfotransferase family